MTGKEHCEGRRGFGHERLSGPTSRGLTCGFRLEPPVGRQCASGSPTPSDIEGSTDRDWVGLCFETEKSRCALDSRMAQEHSNRLQLAGALQDVEPLRPT